METKYFNTIRVMADLFTADKFGLYWTDESTADGGEFICSVYGFENAVRVANGIAHEQADYVIHP